MRLVRAARHKGLRRAAEDQPALGDDHHLPQRLGRERQLAGAERPHHQHGQTLRHVNDGPGQLRAGGAVEAVEGVVEDQQRGRAEHRLQQQDLARLAGGEQPVAALPQRLQPKRREQRMTAARLAQQLPHAAAGVDALIEVALVRRQLRFVERLLRFGREQPRPRHARLRERARRSICPIRWGR